MLRATIPGPLKAFRRSRNANAVNGIQQNDDKDYANEAERGKPHEETENGPVGFWDPSLRQVRNRAFAKWTITTAVLMAFILAVLSIY